MSIPLVSPNTEPSLEELEQAVKTLHRLKPGLLPKAIFLEVTRLTTTSIIEIVPLRHGKQGVEVLLLQRDADDPNWPSMLHTPGTVVRATDVENGIMGPMSRLFESELGIPRNATPVTFVDYVLHVVARGAESAAIFLTDLTTIDVPNGKWYPADQLPETVVSTQTDFISRAVDKFTRKDS